MSQVPDDLRYTESHEWVRVEGGNARVGITDHAQAELTDVVFVELPEVGRSYAKGDAAGVVESVKAAADVYMPLAGEVTEVNEALSDSPEAINDDPYGEGWMVKVRLSDTSEAESLLDAAAYTAQLD